MARVQLFCDDESLTKQSFKKDCDVNYIMSKYSYNRIAEHFANVQGNYGDFTNVQDYHLSMNQIIAADEMFMSLPSQLRKRFNNDPAQFLDFVSNDANRDEMRTLGLLKDDVGSSQPTPPEAPDAGENAPE